MVFLDISDKTNLGGFTIRNNIIRGVDEQFPDIYDVGDVILDTLKSKPNHVGQINADTEQKTTFAEMRERSIRCGLWLKKQGIGCEDIVVVCTHNHLDMYIPIFGIFYTGAIYNAWDHQVTLKPARYLMKLFQPKFIFACETAAKVLTEAAQIEKISTKMIVFGNYIGLTSLDHILKQQSSEEVLNFCPVKVKSPKETAFILLSSGSTGFPKGVMHSYGNMLKIIKSGSAYPMKDTSLWYSTCYWITGFAFIFESLFSFGTRIIHAEFEPEDTCRVIEKYKINRMYLSPTNITYLCKSNILKKYNLRSLNIVTTGGSKANLNILKEFKENLPQAILRMGYGMSETGRLVTIQTDRCKSVDSVGIVTPCTQIKIVDTVTNLSLGPNKPGELCLKPLTTMLGYYKNVEATDQAIDEEGWLHSGDIGYYNENGEIFIIDKLKNIMKYQNHQVSPSEIEEVLFTHPGVMEVAVVPIPDEIDGERPMAFVKMNPDVTVTEEELIQLSSSLGRVKKLSGGVKLLDEMPKTPSGKINYMMLKKIAKKLSS